MGLKKVQVRDRDKSSIRVESKIFILFLSKLRTQESLFRNGNEGLRKRNDPVHLEA